MGANCSTQFDQMGQTNGGTTSALTGGAWPVDSGVRQSPIDIDTSKVIVDQRIAPLRMVYPETVANLVLINTGYGWRVDLPEMVAAKTELIGGPLQGHRYRMAQFHCHWGPDAQRGSEHTVNSRSYAAELHFVHWNCTRYSTPEAALCQPDGLAVVAVLIDIGYQPNPELSKLLRQLDAVTYKGDRRRLPEPIAIGRLLPANQSYWTYKGSLTTPPLLESVTWIVFSTPIYAATDQVAHFRRLFYCSQQDSTIGGPLLENYRSTQPLNGRVVTFVPYARTKVSGDR